MSARACEGTNNQPQRDEFCKIGAVAGGAWNITIDVLAGIPGVSAFGAIWKVGAVSIQATSAIVGRDATGGTLTGTGFGLDLAKMYLSNPAVQAGLKDAGRTFARGVPIVGAVVTGASFAKDAWDAAKEYWKCPN